MKKVLLTLATIVCLTSCSDDPGNQGRNGFYRDTSVYIRLADSQGNDLFQTPEYDSDNFRIFDLKNGQTIEVYNASLDYPRNFYIDNSSMILALNHPFDEDYSETIIKWNSQDSDTVKIHLGIDDPTFDKFWYNGELVYDLYDNPGIGPLVTIVK